MDSCPITESRCLSFCPRCDFDLDVASRQVHGVPYSDEPLGEVRHVLMARSSDEERLPTDANSWDIANKKLIVRDDEILTLTANRAAQYGIARAVVSDVDQALAFFEERDGVKFAGEPEVYETNWSEEMVRLINSPAVMSILVLLAFLGVYLELNSPGVGLPGLVAVICFVIIIGSKYLIGLANWVEVAIFALGITDFSPCLQ